MPVGPNGMPAPAAVVVTQPTGHLRNRRAVPETMTEVGPEAARRAHVQPGPAICGTSCIRAALMPMTPIFSGSPAYRHATRVRHEVLHRAVIMPGPAAPTAGERARVDGIKVKFRGQVPPDWSPTSRPPPASRHETSRSKDCHLTHMQADVRAMHAGPDRIHPRSRQPNINRAEVAVGTVTDHHVRGSR